MNRMIVNFKQYRESTGRSALSMIDTLQKAHNFHKIDGFFAVSATDLLSAAEIYGKNIIAQHVDMVKAGAYTGHISYETLLSIGVKGSLLNHSERRVSIGIISETVNVCHENGLEITLCAATLEEVKSFSDLPVRFIAYEPPDLIGGNVSVSTANPEIIREAALVCDRADKLLLVGAGIKLPEDGEKSIELGASGILISSGVVLSKDPAHALSSLAKALS